MEIKIINNHFIITPLSPKLDFREASRIKQEIFSTKSCTVGLDLSFVKDCTIDFLEEIGKLKNISVFNISSDIFALFSLMNLDKTLNLYVSKLDFLENKRRILNRHLSLLAR